ncbi:hypothetical protein AB838_00355 [Rhodobacteraceae bacterium (ex Bugula neritina AB1)]|nr:hypothetical protein AB838_00355 [Rhodobacteraceae bacterium (ex Bugula neritina AB1)]
MTLAAEKTKDKGPGRVLAVLIVIVFTCVIGATYGFGLYLLPAVVAEMKAEIGFDYTAVGTITAVSQIGFLAAALLSGVLAPRLSAAVVIVVSAFLCAAGLFALSFADSLAVIAMIFVVLGACTASAWTPMVSVISRTIPFAHRAKALGLIASGTNYGVFLNGLLVPYFLTRQHWRDLWEITAALTFLISIACLLLMAWSGLLRRQPSSPAQDTADQLVQSGSLKEVLAARPMLVWAIMFLSGCSSIPFLNYFSLFLQSELGLSVEVAGQAWMLIGLLGMIGGVTVGAIGDHIGVRATLALMYILILTAALCLLFGTGLAFVHCAAFLFGIAFNGVFGLVPAYVTKTYKENLRVGIFSGCNIFLGLGSMLGNFLAGWGKSVTGSFTGVYLAIAAILALLIFLCSRLHRDTTSPDPHPAPENAVAELGGPALVL